MTFRFLVSFHYHQKTDLQSIVDAYDGPCRIFADSGAFSAHTVGSEINLADYIAWLKDWQGLITTASTLDVIGDPEATQRNTLAMEKAGLSVIPVFHTGSPWKRLHELCKRYPYVALGGMVPYTSETGVVMRWLIGCFKIAKEYGTVFHGFGMTNLKTLAALPFYSADSSTWSTGMRYGRMCLWDDRQKKIIQVVAGDREGARKHAALIRSHGADPVRVGTPGFASQARRTPEEFRAENLMMRGAPAIAYVRFGEWLIKRHQVQPPSGLAEHGTQTYLAQTDMGRMRSVAAAIGTEVHLAADANTKSFIASVESVGTEIYLADTRKQKFFDAAESLGTHIHLADNCTSQLLSTAATLKKETS